MRAVSAVQVAVYVVLLIIGIAAGYALGGAIAPAGRMSTVTATTTERVTITQPTVALSGDILIGALLPLSGDLASEGAMNKVAVEMAIDDLNNYVKSLGLPITFKPIIEDTETKAATALAKLQSLYARGVRVVVGPMSSAEVRNLKSYADGNKIVVCSQSSTAQDLAVPDYIFRDVPNDLFQGKAIARLMIDYGIKYIYILYRNDAWGAGLANTTKARYEQLGGKVLGVTGFDPGKGEYSSELSAAASAVRDAVSKYGASSVGVLLISFEEGGTVVAQADSYPDLMGVTWFGSDGTAQNTKILEAAGTQLAKTKHLATIFAPTESPKFVDFVNRFKAKTGELPGTYAATAYDCVWLLGLSIIQAGKYDGEAIRSALPMVAKTYFGVSGWTVLDDNGDRASGDYDVWAVVMKDGKPTWEKVAVVKTDTDTVEWVKKI